MRRSVYVPFAYVRFGRGSCAGAQINGGGASEAGVCAGAQITAKFRFISTGFVQDLRPSARTRAESGRPRVESGPTSQLLAPERKSTARACPPRSTSSTGGLTETDARLVRISRLLVLCGGDSRTDRRPGRRLSSLMRMGRAFDWMLSLIRSNANEQHV